MSVASEPSPKQESCHLSDAAIASRFESLGNNCEFGFYQRTAGVEPLGLLRWSGINLPGLLRGIAEDFGAENPDLELKLVVLGNLHEFVLQAPRFQWNGHTFKYQGQADAAALREEQIERYRFLARKLMHDLQDGQKIFVYKQNDPIVDDSIIALYDALNWYGDNSLLWVCEADDEHPPGTVHFLRDRLMKGHIDRLSPKATGDLVSVPGWSAVCRRAVECWAQESAGRTRARLLRAVLLQEIDFGASGNATPFIEGGWHKPEREFAWASGPRSTVNLDRPGGFDDYALRIKVKPFRPDGLLKQRMAVLVNGHAIKRFSAVPEADIVCTFPASLLGAHDRLEIGFDCPGAMSPFAARLSNDRRELAVQFRTLRLFGLDRQ